MSFVKMGFQLHEIDAVAQKILYESASNIFRFDGAMGAGKTTLIASICKTLGISEPISSPTFSLVNTYNLDGTEIYHFDFYRLNDANEALDFGLEEYFDSGAFCLLEWAEKIEVHLPLDYNHFRLSIKDENTRTIEKIN